MFLTIKDVKDLISLEWTIMGISITVFLIWNVVTIEYLEKSKPIKPNNSSQFRQWWYIREKESFYSEATQLLNNLYLLLINLLCLCCTTGYIYIANSPLTIFSQNIVIWVLFLCTNTIIALILDILKPFNKKKKAILNEAKITNEDLELQNTFNEETENMYLTIETIKKLRSIDEKEKNKLIFNLVKKFLEPNDDELKPEVLNSGNTNDQL